jgi:Ca2+-binding RTX toxin-like protein
MGGSALRPSRAWSGAGAAVALLAVAAATAGAATTVAFKPGGGRFDAFSGVAVQGDRGANRITVGLEVTADRFVIRDKASRMVGEQCERIDRHALRCETAFDGGLRVRGEDGDDSLRLRRNMPHSGILIGGRGQDLIRGGAREDFLDGGGARDLISGGNGGDSLDGRGGDDVMRGGAGDDLLGAVEEPGRDVFSGGGGRDDISAVNRDADRRIDCGPGPDIAYVDPEDPRAKRCEQVKTIRL